LQTVCKFLKHLRTVEPATEVPDNAFRKSPRRNPRLLSDQEVASLMEAAGRIRTCSAFRRLTVATLYGLLASTGLRIGEAHRLKDEDAHLDAEPPHLIIHETKFGKSRIVVLHATVVQELRNYTKQRTVELGTRSAEMFFSNRKGTPLSYNCSDTTLRLLVRQLGIKSIPGERTVSLHSFRHSFAVNRLTKWHREGKNAQEMLPHLSVYMGHLNPKDTYWYLSATPELMEAASSRFEINHKKGAE
jgi:integrase